jgi:FdhD protein
MTPLHEADRIAWRLGSGPGSGASPGRRVLAEEMPVAFTFNRTTYAVMLATPADLEDFAVGFSLTEGVIGRPGDIQALEVLEVAGGIELRMDLLPERLSGLEARRRRLAGFGGCGLCGMESIAEAVRLPGASPPDSTWRIAAATLAEAIAAMPARQALNRQARALHAAAFLRQDGGIMAVAEDVGRHNALDKLIGWLARQDIVAGQGELPGGLLVSSRVSVELVQKAARVSAPLLAAVSAPTAFAVRLAEQAGITVVGVARDDGFEVFTHPERIVD